MVDTFKSLDTPLIIILQQKKNYFLSESEPSVS